MLLTRPGAPPRSGGRLVAAAAIALLAVLGCGSEETAEEAAAPPTETPPGTSELWGAAGEAWHPRSRLPDFSYAGYRRGEVPLPEPPVVADVGSFGAVGDGESDDTDAFLAAIEAAGEGALLIPPGRYRITRPLWIRKSNLVLRGGGRDETVLFFPRPLFEALGKGKEGGPTGWSWGGAWIRFLGEIADAPPLARVAAPAERGASAIELSTTAGIAAGDWVRLVQYETDGSLSDEIHAGHPLLSRCNIAFTGHRSMDWAVRVERVEGRRVDLGRPLRIAVRPEWGAELLPFLPSVEEVGVEHLTIEFPETDYPGHHKGRGYNAIEMRAVFNGWVRDVRVVNFDNGVHFFFSRYMTGRDIVLEGRGGHYGLGLQGSQDSLMTGFDVVAPSAHDLSVANLSNGCVFSRGRGTTLNFDHHRGASYENLFSDLHVGDAWQHGRLWWQSDTPSGHYTAARETFWNIRPRIKPQFVPFWPQMNIIGRLKSNRPFRPGVEQLDLWAEHVPNLRPRDLHGAQLERRLSATGHSSRP